MKKRKRMAIAVAALAAAMLVGGFLYINASLRPVLIGLSKARIESVAARAMNDAILEVLRHNDTANELLNIYASDNGVYLLQANSGRLNVLAADCAIAAQQRITALGDQGISVPIGTLSGIPLFSGSGPSIVLEFTPAGAVQSSFSSEFRSAGINQTLHRITLCLTASVRIILPGEAHTVTVSAEAPIAENIIVGDVPDAYTNVADEEDLLNLVPEAP